VTIDNSANTKQPDLSKRVDYDRNQW